MLRPHRTTPRPRRVDLAARRLRSSPVKTTPTPRPATPPGNICTWAGNDPRRLQRRRPAARKAPVLLAGRHEDHQQRRHLHPRLEQPQGPPPAWPTAPCTPSSAPTSSATATGTPRTSSQPGVPGTDINLNHPTQLLEEPGGTLLLVSWHNHKLRRFDPKTGLAYVVARSRRRLRGRRRPGQRPRPCASTSPPVARSTPTATSTWSTSATSGSA